MHGVALAACVLLLGYAAAYPDKQQQHFCSYVKSDLSRASETRRATAFCASFLDISTATSTVTRTTARRTQTATVTGANTGPTTTPIVTVTVQSTAFVTDGCPSSTAEVVPRRLVHGEKLARDVHARPVPTPSCFKSLACAEISKACHCLSIPTPTSTVTISKPAQTATITTTVHGTTTFTAPTATATSTNVTTVQLCQCSGLNGVGYEGTFDQLPADQNYSQYQPESFDYSAAGTSFGGSGPGLNYETYADPQITVFYGSSFEDAHGSDANRSMILVDHFYLQAPTTGTYQFSIPDSNTIAFLWVGPKAYRGWTRANADIIQQNGQPVQSFSTPLVAGLYTPVRLFYAHAAFDYGFFGFKLVGPGGTTEISVPVNNTMHPTSDTPTPYIYQYSCDPANLAPPFPDDGMFLA